MRLSARFALCLAVALPLLVALAGLLVLGLVSRDLRAERDDQLTARLRALTPMATSYAWRTRVLPAVPPGFLQQRLTTGSRYARWHGSAGRRGRSTRPTGRGRAWPPRQASPRSTSWPGS